MGVLQDIEEIVLPPVDEDALKAEDDQIKNDHPNGGVPLRVATQINQNIKPSTMGTNETLPDPVCREMWRIKLTSHNAKFMSIQLAMARLGYGEEIYVYSAADPGEAVGPFTEADNTDLQVLGIPAVQGDSIVVEFTHPGV